MGNFDKEALAKIFSGVSKDKLESAMKKAEVLSKNPEVRNSFSKISEAEIKSMLSALTDGDKKKIISKLSKGGNSEINELINNLKNHL